jgi:hypothetical protein
MSVDRLLAVRFPLTSQRLCTSSRAKKAIVVATIVIAIINIHIFFAYKYIMDAATGRYRD